MRLYVITDDARRPPDEIARICEAAIRGGATAIQLREKSAPPERVLECFDALRRVCDAHGAPLFVNGDLLPHLPSEKRVAAVHLNRKQWNDISAWSKRGALVGYSAHNIKEAQDAIALGAHFITLGPLFETPSKTGILMPIGCTGLKRARKELPDAVLVALGGIDPSNALECIKVGADGIAVIRAIMAAPDPEEAARELRAAIS